MGRQDRLSQLLNELPTSGSKINTLRRTQEVFACLEIQRKVRKMAVLTLSSIPPAMTIE
jgi:hypothetical protein